MKIHTLVVTILLIPCLLLFGGEDVAKPDSHPPAELPVAANSEINERLNALVTKHKIPGMVAGIVRGNDLIAVGAAGVRKKGSPELMTVRNKMHIGSCTKAMTAMRIAMLVEQGKLNWDSTISSVFPDEVADIHPDWHDVTLTQLLTHRAGMPANWPWNKLGMKGTPTEQRLSLLRSQLKKPPEIKPGTRFLYSNAGYALAGAMAEKVTGQSWEDLMRDGLFQPLDMTSAGFGPPGKIGAIVEPWGHLTLFGLLIPQQEDNPASLGPAGTVHVSIPDWAKFAALHLKAKRGHAIHLQPATFAKLHTPPEDEFYAMGWAIQSPKWAKSTALTHDGSNTMWYASVWIFPDEDLVLLVAVNCADGPSQLACQEAIHSLFEYIEAKKQ